MENKHGLGEEIMVKQRRKKNTLVSSVNSHMHPNKKNSYVFMHFPFYVAN